MKLLIKDKNCLIVSLFPTKNCKNQFLKFFTFVRGPQILFKPNIFQKLFNFPKSRLNF